MGNGRDKLNWKRFVVAAVYQLMMAQPVGEQVIWNGYHDGSRWKRVSAVIHDNVVVIIDGRPKKMK